MKRIILIGLMFTLIVYCFADDFDLDNIPKTHYGIWIPKEFDDSFKKDCNPAFNDEVRQKPLLVF